MPTISDKDFQTVTLEREEVDIYGELRVTLAGGALTLITPPPKREGWKPIWVAKNGERVTFVYHRTNY